MKPKFVARRDIDLVLDGLKKYFQLLMQTQKFSAEDMKNFMEPIFERAGYRDQMHGGGRQANKTF